jgi:hypothetical protein
MKKEFKEFEELQEFKNGNPDKRRQPDAVELHTPVVQYSTTPLLHYSITPPTLAVLSQEPDAVKPHPQLTYPQK